MVRDDTSAVHGWKWSGEQFGSVVTPVYLSTVYRYLDEEHAMVSDRGKVIKYAREETPTVRALERVIASLEGYDDALAFSSGMASISTLMLRVLEPGCRLIVPLEMYSTTLQLLESLSRKIGFDIIKVWPSADAIIDALEGNDRAVKTVIFLEVMSNPTLKVIDLDRISRVVRDRENTTLVVDNTFTTPILLHPKDYSASATIHSLTKYLAGHNDVIGGAVAASSAVIQDLWDWRRMLGTVMQPFEAYLTIRGIKTLRVRFVKQCENARAIAEYLLDHPKVEDVMYPGLPSSPYHSIANKIFRTKLYGAVVSFVPRGKRDSIIRFLKELKVITPSPSLGGPESLISIASASAAKYIPPDVREELGIKDTLLRLSVGLEDVNDLIEDLGKAFAKI